MEILIRLGIAALIICAGIVLYLASTRLRLFVLRRRATRNIGLGVELRDGVPAILYFSTPDCAPCHTVQEPVSEELRAQYGDRLQIVQIDASQRTDLANAWGILSVPTTFIVDGRGQPRHVNNGVTPAPRLRQQLREFAGLTDAGEGKPRTVVREEPKLYHTQRS